MEYTFVPCVVAYWAAVTACAHCFDAMQRVLEISRRDDHRIDVLAIVKFIVVARFGDFVTGDLGERVCAIVAAAIPNIRDRNDVEIQFFRVLHE